MRRPPVATADLVRGGDGRTYRATLELGRGGSHELWVGGAFRGSLDVWLDGKALGSDRHELSHSGQWVALGTTVLDRGPHALELKDGGADLRPGSRGRGEAVGPVALSTATADLPVGSVPAAEADSLCGERLDWVEALPR